MKILMCSVPDGPLERTLQPLIPWGNNRQIPIRPVGILRLMTWMEKKGYSSDIYDINNLRPSDEELIKNFKRTKPTVVGLSATLSHCYPNVKRITKILRKLFPDVWIILGGHLTGSANVILNKTETNICVVGDGEIPFAKLLDYFKLHPSLQQIDYTELYKIKGLAFVDENHKLQVTGYAEQVPASELKYPDYDIIKTGLQKYGGNGELIHEFFEPIKICEYNPTTGFGIKFDEKVDKNKKIAIGYITRGCVARCTFCQRASKGYRVYEADHNLEAYLEELKEKYNVGLVEFWDENFGSNRKQSYEVARIMKKHDMLWRANFRPTSITYEDLKFFKEHNMVAVQIGIESGSKKIMDIMEKKYTAESVYKVVEMAKKLDLYLGSCVDGVILGMPGETKETIIDTAKHIASLRYVLGLNWHIKHNSLALAIPGTPLYEYCQQIGIIGKTLEEEEDYIIRMAEHKYSQILAYLNKTDSSIKEFHYWIYLYPYAAKKAYVDLIIKNNKSIRNRLSQIYEQCIKGTFKSMFFDYNQRKNSYKNKKLLQKMKWYVLISINFLLTLGVPFLPKAVLFSIVRVYANLRFHTLKKNNKVNKGKQKDNLFVERPVETNGDYKITDDRFAKATREIDRSLRSFVMDNRKKMKPAITDEEKSLQVLAQGQ